MKRMILISFVIMLGLFFGLTAQAGPVVNPPGTWTTPDDFTTKFWKEKFFGGRPGAPGNVLMAIGEGFVFQNAVLEGVVINPDGIPPWCLALGGLASYVTRYEGGMLTLNSSGPWLKKGSLKATDVTATNTSCHDGGGNLLGFKLTMEGPLDKSTYSFIIDASFDVTPDNYEVKMDADGVVFQVGYDFDATITLY